jgi:ATP-binding cassette subfamily B multidrug efflux pump
VKGAKRWLALMAAMTAIIALGEVMLFGFIGNVVDWLGKADRGSFIASEWPRLVFIAVFVLVVMPIVAVVQSGVINQGLMGNLPQRIRWMIHRYVLRQSMSYFQDEFAGRVATNLMQTALAIRDTAMKLFDVLNYVVFYFIGAVVLAAYNDWRLAVPFVIWVIAYVAILRHFIPRFADVSAQQANARAVMTGRVVDAYTNITTVKLFSHSQREEAYAREAMEEFLPTVYGQMRYASYLSISIYSLTLLLLAAILFIGIGLWLNSAISVGAVATAAALALRFFGLGSWVMWELSALFENIGTVRTGANAFSVPMLVTDRPDAPQLVVREGGIAFDDVSFHYGRQKGIIEHLSFSVKPGEKVGLVGRSGAGKTTIVNLLLRFYDLESGRISIDGQDIAGVTQESLRAAVGVVSQDTSLLHRSVRENIVYGRPGATEAQMIAAAKNAEADEFVSGLADRQGRAGYDAHVGERGVKLSGGQRQRIAIARVLLKDAPVLVLDEATSALDSEVEAAIQSQLHRLMQDKTVIAIAHRLSTIAAMDRLIVIDQGRVVEQGTHAELIALGGEYARLWARQSGGFLEPDEDAPAPKGEGEDDGGDREAAE